VVCILMFAFLFAHAQVDISLASDSGPRASAYIAQCCTQYPCLRPLVLAARTYLKVPSCRPLPCGCIAVTNCICLNAAYAVHASSRALRLWKPPWPFRPPPAAVDCAVFGAERGGVRRAGQLRTDLHDAGASHGAGSTIARVCVCVWIAFLVGDGGRMTGMTRTGGCTMMTRLLGGKEEG
jgi:hypothetical protein